MVRAACPDVEAFNPYCMGARVARIRQDTHMGAGKGRGILPGELVVE